MDRLYPIIDSTESAEDYFVFAFYFFYKDFEEEENTSLRKAYRELSKKLHPDRLAANVNVGSEMFKKLENGYQGNTTEKGDGGLLFDFSGKPRSKYGLGGEFHGRIPEDQLLGKNTPMSLIGSMVTPGTRAARLRATLRLPAAAPWHRAAAAPSAAAPSAAAHSAAAPSPAFNPFAPLRAGGGEEEEQRRREEEQRRRKEAETAMY